MFDIRVDDLSGAPTRDLLRLHLAGMQAHSPACGVFALDVSGLQAPDVIMWSVWIGADIAGIGALRMIAPGHGEIKSMRTHPDHLRKGVSAALLRHIIAVARDQGAARLSLETGSGPAFDPAIALYRAHGFVEGAAFGDYANSDFNCFYHRDL
ncbi:MAG: GNAT family N-acetyltransferase [Sphingobium sp.]|jgi:putative acetyltransferase|uniref:GNAT family N-acetyltransferase n=1 Tax=Sphingobium sp. TaxID=1912891 RepID=UPI001A2B23B7|nr:GNAT family N-acetyltransferase [Sphingobium sp.]MBJ7443957.1 GNAT family N-acetyltransferase [Sphingobium sp.]